MADEAADRWNVIKDSGDAALIAQFREDFPGSPFDLDALVILAALITQTDTGDAPASGAVTFIEPLSGFGETLERYSLSTLLKTSPVFPPIEGLPEEYWKNKTCSTCHEWTQATLCTQATHYTKDENVHRLNIQHPLGRPFKEALRAWAEGGCL
ncbi:hypothetical protein [Litoreibacter meonggei]|nr:hypothetical protein [Litoreibacter meonggei]